MNDKSWEELKKDLNEPDYVEQFITAAIYLITEENNDTKQ